ncbi:P-loop containing nucleoside triphosphate hydrolase protein [Laetiporus sulphureus 93-53]|uniref:p-loop containing nucleoside triphosphate hydrolase protein n=1 Tax=Laetiporus sulphureus 93-53 TaxID=1314785 RepID=A0A165EQL1_9APHY|nr:P-loop containing nucleoside triphosphate hydrolase protein [Laetiporus sulphureus 93-53]KZT07558.1 P-loop containing nucleoside triphosphate hydrolase protein [Laetiporus sulphureus 93-53]
MLRTHGLGPALKRRYSAKSALKIFQNAGLAKCVAKATNSESIPASHGLPEIIVTGRANVGKSTLLNAVLGRRDLLPTSNKAGKTRSLDFYLVGAEPGKLIVVDAPGYGSRGRPEWGDLFRYYVSNRQELRRVYVLISAILGLNEADRAMLAMLDEQCQASGGTSFTLQAIVTKADGILDKRDAKERVTSIRRGIFEAAPTCLPMILTSAGQRPFFGVDDVRANIADACALV